MMTIHVLLKHKETAVHFHRVADENGQQNSHQTNIYETMHPWQSVWGNISMEFLEAFLFRVTTDLKKKKKLNADATVCNCFL